MKDATLAQGNEVLNLILKKRVPASQIQALLESGLLSDILEANIGEIDRFEFLRFIGLRERAIEVLYVDFMRFRDIGKTRLADKGECGVCHREIELMPIPGEEVVVVLRHSASVHTTIFCEGDLKPPITHD